MAMTGFSSSSLCWAAAWLKYWLHTLHRWRGLLSWATSLGAVVDEMWLFPLFLLTGGQLQQRCFLNPSIILAKYWCLLACAMLTWLLRGSLEHFLSCLRLKRPLSGSGPYNTRSEVTELFLFAHFCDKHSVDKRRFLTVGASFLRKRWWFRNK